MKNIKLYAYSLVVALLFSTTGCEYGNENIDPTRQGNVDIQFILPAALTQAAYNQMASPARMAGILMQHFSGFDAQQIDIEKYLLNENSLNNYWNFGVYGGVMKDCANMIELGEAQELPHYVGIAKILMANALGSCTSVFGDMPYSEALKGVEVPKPIYDTQEQIYAAIQTLLDEAIASLAQTQSTGVINDLIFGGDAAKWTSTAHALKARYYMHVSKQSGSAAASALVSLGNAFTSNANQPTFNFGTALVEANPFALFGDGRPKTLIFNPGFEAKLVGDPRHDLYTVQDGTEWLFYNGASGLFWASNNSPSPLISFTELEFIRAEALLITGAAGADAALTSAVSSNMDFLGVSTADRDAYLATLPAATIETVMNEAYKALYGQAELEVWTNFRRTGFPTLTPHPQGANGNNPSGVIPTRCPYPQNESITNEANLNEAIARQGADLADTKLWAFK